MNSFQDVFYEFTFVVGENWRRIYIYISYAVDVLILKNYVRK